MSSGDPYSSHARQTLEIKVNKKSSYTQVMSMAYKMQAVIRVRVITANFSYRSAMRMIQKRVQFHYC